MAATSSLYELAKAGHRVWCEQMLQAGWSPGESYDPQSMTHDALVVFDELRRIDQTVAMTKLQVEDMPRRIASLVEPDRSATRVFGVDEITRGLPVGYAGSSSTPPREPGRIDSWEIDDDGELSLIRVIWADGRLEEFDPFEMVLRRLS